MKYIRCLTVITLFLFSIVASGCVDQSEPNLVVTTNPTIDIHKTPTARVTAKATTVAKENLQLLNAEIQTGDYGSRYIVGQIKNNAADRTYKYVQVTINLYDDSGAQVGSTLANVNNLEPSGIWKFKAFILEKGATNFKVKEITGF